MRIYDTVAVRYKDSDKDFWIDSKWADAKSLDPLYTNTSNMRRECLPMRTEGFVLALLTN